MTTVVYRDGILASDSKVTGGGHVYEGNVKKIFKTKFTEQLSFMDRVVFRKTPNEIDYLIGFCGAMADAQDYIDCIFNGEPRTKEEYDCTVMAVHLDQNGKEVIEVYDGNSLNAMVFNTNYLSIGSGSSIALGALYHGASAVEALNAAIFHDNHSGGTIQTLSFKE